MDRWMDGMYGSDRIGMDLFRFLCGDGVYCVRKMTNVKESMLSVSVVVCSNQRVVKLPQSLHIMLISTNGTSKQGKMNEE